MREIKITDTEALAVGVSKDMVGWGPLIRPLLIERGVPEGYLNIGDRRCVLIRRDEDGTVFGVYEP